MKKKPARRVARRQVGTLESIGARLDESGVLIATGALQFGFLAIIAAALLAFLYTVFSGQITNLPQRLAALPEEAARGLGLNVMRVTIKGGDNLTERQIMVALRDAEAGSIIGRPLLTLDPDALRTAVESLGPVKSAAVTKLLPDTVHISVVERKPRALYENGEGEFFVIDAGGVIIRAAEPTQYTDLITISGTDDPASAMAFFALLRKHPVLFARTAGIEVVSERRFDIRFRNGFLAKLPEDGVDAALDRLQSLEAGTGSLAAKLDYFDLRNPDYAYFKLKGEEQKDAP